jgi:membrane associated rhomboid family serine protease
MIPIGDRFRSRQTPAVTIALAALIIFVFFWDRGRAWLGLGLPLSNLAFRPQGVVDAFRGEGDPMDLVKLYTSLFLHGNLAHLAGNLLYLAAFGPRVEAALGGLRFALYYLAWGLMAAAAHIFVEPGSPTPTLGASGAIGGILGAYLILFPAARIQVIVLPLIFLPFWLRSWILLTGWFLVQVLVYQQGVATWAHVGGFLAGMATILVMGGREKVLQRRMPEALHA